MNKPDQGNQELVSLEYAASFIREHQLMKEALETIRDLEMKDTRNDRGDWNASTHYEKMQEISEETLKQITL